MDDRVAEIREALDYLDRTLGSHVYRRDIQPLADAARAYVDLLDSDALITRRDDARQFIFDLVMNVGFMDEGDMDDQALASELTDEWLGRFDALAASQGVEPQ